MTDLSGLVKNLCLLGGTALDHIGDDPTLFALQVSRRLPERVVQASAATVLKLPVGGSLRPFARYVAGDVQATRDSLAHWADRGVAPRKAVRLAEIALAANLPQIADDLVSGIPSGTPGLPEFCSRRSWNEGDMTGAISVLDSGKRRQRKQRIRLESELRVFEGWRPELAGIPGYSSRPRTVLHFLTNSLPHTSSGYAQRSHSLLKAQAEEGWTVHAATRQGYPALVGKLTGSCVETIDGVNYHRLLAARLPLGMERRLQAQAEALFDLAVLLRPAVLHTTTHFVNALTVSAVARALGIPWVYEVRGLLAETWASTRPMKARRSERHQLFTQREQDATQVAHAVITLGEAMKTAISAGRDSPSAKVELVPNAVGEGFLAVPATPPEARRLLGLNPDTPTIGTVSSLVSYEGLDDLIRAFAQLAPRYPDLACLIVGSGSESAHLKTLAADLGVRDRVTFPGRVERSQGPLYHQALDIFVLPRQDLPVTRAVTPLKPIEALASSRPVIFSDLPALHESVRDGIEGLAVEAQNPGSLAAALESLLGAPDRRIRMGETGRTRVLAERTWQAAAAQTIATYERLKVANGRN